MQQTLRHIQERFGGPKPTGASTSLSHPTDPSASPDPYNSRTMYPPSNPSRMSNPNTNSGHLYHASSSDPSYGQPGISSNLPRSTGGNPPSGSYSTNPRTPRHAYVEDAHDHEAGMGSVDRLDTGGPWGRETLEDYGYYDSGIEAGHGTGRGANAAAAPNKMGGAGGHHWGEERSSAHVGAHVGREEGAEAMREEALRARREREFDGGVSGMGGRKESVRE